MSKMLLLIPLVFILPSILHVQGFYVHNCPSVSLPKITNFKKVNTSVGEKVEIVFKTDLDVKAVKWFQDSMMRMFLWHYVLFTINGSSVKSSIGNEMSDKVMGGLERKNNNKYVTWMEYNTKYFNPYNLVFLSIIVSANNCSQFEYDLQIKGSFKPVIPTKMPLVVPPYLVRLEEDSSGMMIKSNFSIDPRLGKIQSSRVETSGTRRRGFSTAYAGLKTKLVNIDEKMTTNTTTKVTNTLIFKKFGEDNQGLYYRSAWVSQLPASIFPHLFYPYTTFLFKQKTGIFGADVNGCSYGESFIDESGITIPVSYMTLDCFMCTSYGYPAPNVMLVSAELSPLPNVAQYTIGGIRTQAVTSVIGDSSVVGRYKCLVYQNGKLEKSIPFQVSRYDSTTKVTNNEYLIMVKSREGVTIIATFVRPRFGKSKCSFYIGKRIRMKNMKKPFDPLYKINKNVSVPINEIPGAFVTKLSEVSRTLKLKLVLSPEAFNIAERKFGGRMRIYSVMESKYVSQVADTYINRSRW